MSHKGRCFRDSRRTARRKARQDAAVTEMHRLWRRYADLGCVCRGKMLFPAGDEQRRGLARACDLEYGRASAPGVEHIREAADAVVVQVSSRRESPAAPELAGGHGTRLSP